MTATHRITRGFDVRIAGRAAAEVADAPEPLLVGVKPTDFLGVKPKLVVKEGERVLTGQPLFFDKNDPEVRFAAPATGPVTRISLGPRRAPLCIEISPEPTDQQADATRLDPDRLATTPREDLVTALKHAGLWPLIRQRPLGKLARDGSEPSAVYVNGMDTEPLAADQTLAVRDRGAHFQLGIDLLRRLCGSGKAYLTVRDEVAQPKEFVDAKGVEVHSFAGPHPAGLVGTHIRAIAPLGPGQRALYLKAQEACLLGEWLATGRYPTHRLVAVAGTAAPERKHFRVRQGAAVMTLTGGKPLSGDVRVISGTVLTGEAVEPEGFLGFYAQTLTVIPEGKGQRQLLGWALPQLRRHSASRAVLSWLLPRREYDLDAQSHGGPRAVVNVGTWERMTSLDIHPTYLMRAIQANDLEEAIDLGLLEVTEEDVALCAFADPCKTEIGPIVRQGLDLYEQEGGT